MDDAKKKKMMLGVLAVVALGAGAYFTGVFGGDSGGKKAAVGSGPLVKKDSRPTEQPKLVKKQSTKAAPEEKEGVVKKEREEETPGSIERKKKRSDKKDEKKKQSAPAA